MDALGSCREGIWTLTRNVSYVSHLCELQSTGTVVCDAYVCSLDGKNRDGASRNRKKQSVSGPVLETKQNKTEENRQAASRSRKKQAVSSPVLETEKTYLPSRPMCHRSWLCVSRREIRLMWVCEIACGCASVVEKF